MHTTFQAPFNLQTQRPRWPLNPPGCCPLAASECPRTPGLRHYGRRPAPVWPGPCSPQWPLSQPAAPVGSRASGSPHSSPGRARALLPGAAAKAQLCVQGPGCCPPLAPSREDSSAADPQHTRQEELLNPVALFPSGCLLKGTAMVWLRPVCPQTRFPGSRDRTGLPGHSQGQLCSTPGGRQHQEHGPKRSKCACLGRPTNPSVPPQH